MSGSLAAKPSLIGRVAPALAVAFVVAVVGGAAVGYTRWQDARAFRQGLETRVAAAADALAQQVVREGPDVAFDATSVHVVLADGVDRFGVAGGHVARRTIRDPIALPQDPDFFERDLLVRNAELQDYHERHEAIPVDRRFAAADLGDVALFAAVAPVIAGDRYTGFVRVAERADVPPPSVGLGLVLLGLALALLFGVAVSLVVSPAAPGFVRRERIAYAAAAALPLAILAATPTLAVWAALVAAALAFAAGPGIARVVRGVREKPTTYLYILPAMLALVVLVFVPFVMGVTLAFFDRGEFTGLANFAEILVPSPGASTNFYATTAFTILWTVSNVALHVGIGIALALVLNRENLRFRGLYRVLLVIPWAVPSYITALIWKSMFNPTFGAVNGFLDVLGIEPVNWLGAGSSFASNYIAALTTNTWLGFPFMMVVTLGALQSIPKDLYEAADIDGASRWQKFRRVTLPLLKPALVPAIILGVIWTFNMFNVIYLVTGGAPDNQTNILVTEAFHAFKVLNRFGLAAAYSLLIFAMLLIYGWMQNRITRATDGAFE